MCPVMPLTQSCSQTHASPGCGRSPDFRTKLEQQFAQLRREGRWRDICPQESRRRCVDAQPINRMAALALKTLTLAS